MVINDYPTVSWICYTIRLASQHTPAFLGEHKESAKLLGQQPAMCLGVTRLCRETEKW